MPMMIQTHVEIINQKCPSVVQSTDKIRWSTKKVLDSGCSRHLSNCQEYFVGFTEKTSSVQIFNKEIIQSKVTGTIKIDSIVNRVICNLVLKHVIYIPDIIYDPTSMSVGRRNAFVLSWMMTKWNWERIHLPFLQAKWKGDALGYWK